MKNTNLIILFVLSFALAACHKDKEFDKTDPVVSEVTQTVSTNQATFSWQVDLPGKFQTAVEVSEKEGMDDLKRMEGTKEEDKYTAIVKDLSAGTLYYYRIVVWNKFNRFEKDVETFTTSESPDPSQDTTYYTISVSCQPEEGGLLSGGGTFAEGDTCTITAVANEGYTFVNWTENGSQVSADLEFKFVVTANRSLVANFSAKDYIISVEIDPENGGTISGSGGYNSGDECTLTATANEGYYFINWTKDGTEVSTDLTFTFTVTESAEYVAHFQIQSYIIMVAVDPENGGTVGGGGNYTYGQNCILTATANTGYTFDHWTKDGSTISGEATINVTVTANATYVAYFSVRPEAPIGAIDGLFTINENNDRVFFSQGNLQYIGSAGNGDENNTGAYLKFAEHQWDYLGDNGQGSNNITVDRDLFGWGTSGWNCGNSYYRPWDISKSNGSLYGPYGLYDLMGPYSNSDWGVYNAISNGGNNTDQWRSLSASEWEYILYTRNTPSGIRHAKGCIEINCTGDSINGLILLPDDWDESFYPLNNTNAKARGGSYADNIINDEIWSTLEQHGAVFLPAAGVRRGLLIDDVNITGNIWTSTHDTKYNNNTNATGLPFGNLFIDMTYNRFYRWCGFSVRLIYIVD